MGTPELLMKKMKSIIEDYITKKEYNVAIRWKMWKNTKIGKDNSNQNQKHRFYQKCMILEHSANDYILRFWKRSIVNNFEHILPKMYYNRAFCKRQAFLKSIYEYDLMIFK